MAKISIEIEDSNFDIGAFVSTVAKNSKVTVNIFTSEEELTNSDGVEIEEGGSIVIEEKLPQLTREQLLNKLAKMPIRSREQTLYAQQLFEEHNFLWKDLEKALGIGRGTLAGRIKRLKQHDRKVAKAKRQAKKANKPKPKPKKPDVPKLSDKDIVTTVYSIVSNTKKGGVHFSKTISQSLIESYERRYEANKKLTDFKSDIGGRIDDAMNKIALALGPTKCMSSRSSDSFGNYTTQLLVYTKTLPSQTQLEKAMKELNLL